MSGAAAEARRRLAQQSVQRRTADAMERLLDHVRREEEATPRAVIRACESAGLPGSGSMVLEADPPNAVLMCGLSLEAIDVVRRLTGDEDPLAFRLLTPLGAALIYGWDGSPMMAGLPHVGDRPPPGGRYVKQRYAPSILVPRRGPGFA